jgi:acetyltransferase-like isoleucine patch superfamily enzyme
MSTDPAADEPRGPRPPASPLAPPGVSRRRLGVKLRVAWMIASILIVESLVFGLAIIPGALFWEFFSLQTYPALLIRIVVLGMAFIPAYVIFAICLMILSAYSMRLFGWRTPPDTEMPIKDLGWPLMNWARYMVSVHIVRLFAGSIFRATPLWTFYMRLNGAKLGRGVYVNSLEVNDHNLLEFGDRVIIGGDVHLSGHTVERGVVRTARLRLGDHVSIGIGTIVNIGVEAGPWCQIGALSLVPKFSRLDGHATYVGAPVRKLRDRHVEAGSAHPLA